MNFCGSTQILHRKQNNENNIIYPNTFYIGGERMRKIRESAAKEQFLGTIILNNSHVLTSHSPWSLRSVLALVVAISIDGIVAFHGWMARWARLVLSSALLWVPAPWVVFTSRKCPRQRWPFSSWRLVKPPGWDIPPTPRVIRGHHPTSSHLIHLQRYIYSFTLLHHVSPTDIEATDSDQAPS